MRDTGCRERERVRVVGKWVNDSAAIFAGMGENGMEALRLRDMLKGLGLVNRSGESWRVLDLGCGLGEDLFDLVHCLPGASGTGVDLIPAGYAENLQDEEAEQLFLQKWGHPIPFHTYQFTAGVKTLHELYCRYVRNAYGIEPLEKSVWEGRFTFHWDTDVREYAAACTKPFGIVFCSGVLHWMKREDQIVFLKDLQDCVAEGGVLAIMVNSPSEGGPESEGPFCYVRMHLLSAAFAAWEVLSATETPGRSYLIVRKPEQTL